MSAAAVSVQFIEKTHFLFQPAPYKVLWGGRDGVKSWSIARALLILGTTKPLRILCARETQQSIAESVHQLLEEQIVAMGLGAFYHVEKARILGINGTEFVFAGLKHNVKQIKSFEGMDVCWVEEADNVSKNSWEVLLPTIRKAGSEVWISFNPDLSTDDTYQRWILHPPPGAVVVKTSYRDNVWLTESSRAKIEHLQRTDPAAFDFIYEGNCRSSVEGAIFAAEIRKATEESRICQVPYNRARPVDTAWDLGFGDLTAIWFLQAYDGHYNFIDYLEGDGLTIADYLVMLQERKYVYGTDWVPWDASSVITHKRLSGGNKEMSIEMLMRQAGRRVRIAPQMYIADRINAGRTIFPQCRFDADKCADGLQALRHYQWGPPNANGVRKRDPLHNWASHGSDAFQAAAVAIKQPKVEIAKELPPPQAPRLRLPGSQFTPFG